MKKIKLPELVSTDQLVWVNNYVHRHGDYADVFATQEAANVAACQYVLEEMNGIEDERVQRKIRRLATKECWDAAVDAFRDYWMTQPSADCDVTQEQVATKALAPHPRRRRKEQRPR